MFEKIKKLLSTEKPVENKKANTKSDGTSEPKEKKSRKSSKQKELSPKEIATQNGQPYVNILRMEIDPNDVNNGLFELDWNDKFILNLVRAGYKMRNDDTDQMIVDRWFQTVCRNVALEVYEQQQADPENRDMRVIRSRDIGNGRTEVS